MRFLLPDRAYNARMTSSSENPFKECVAALVQDDTPRVRSFLVSVFGDLAQKEGSQISGSLLSRLTELVDIKPEAMRVALHRLRKEGWIDSQRSGRSSVHFLTGFGRSQSDQATPRIYAQLGPAPKRFHVLIAGTSEPVSLKRLEQYLLTQEYLVINNKAILGEGPVPENCADLLAFEVPDIRVPDWLKTQVCTPELMQEYKCLHASLIKVNQLVTDFSCFDVLDAVALRILIIHSWRRVILKHADLPQYFFPDDWPGENCRRMVTELTARLSLPELETLEEMVA